MVDLFTRRKVKTRFDVHPLTLLCHSPPGRRSQQPRPWVIFSNPVTIKNLPPDPIYFGQFRHADPGREGEGREKENMRST